MQAQILNLLVSLQKRFDLTYVFISHDLGVVRHISDRVGVMYLGRIVELAPAAELYRRPFHPYTEALLSAVPRPKPHGKSARIVLAGDVPSPSGRPPAARSTRAARYRQDICTREAPPLAAIAEARTVACHFPIGRVAEPRKGCRPPWPGAVPARNCLRTQEGRME